MMSLNELMVFIKCQKFKILSKYIIKQHKTLISNCSIHIYISRVNNRLVFKIEDGCKLELQSPQTMKYFDGRKNLKDKTKNRENMP